MLSVATEVPSTLEARLAADKTLDSVVALLKTPIRHRIGPLLAGVLHEWELLRSAEGVNRHEIRGTKGKGWLHHFMVSGRAHFGTVADRAFAGVLNQGHSFEILSLVQTGANQEKK